MNLSRFLSQAILFVLVILFNNCSASKWSTEVVPESTTQNRSSTGGVREPVPQTQPVPESDAAVPTPTPAPTPDIIPTPNHPSEVVPAVPIGGKGLYKTDENLPDQLSSFIVLRGKNLYNYHAVAQTGISALRFPSNWNIMGPTDTIRLAVLVPPGVSSVSWSNEFNSLSQLFGSCAEDGVTCHDQSFTPLLWPMSIGKPLFDPSFDPATAEATTVPRIVFLTIKSTGKEGWLMSLSVSYYVKDPAMYERWRSARKWAGGSGDCDGLGNKYLTGPSCEAQAW